MSSVTKTPLKSITVCVIKETTQNVVNVKNSELRTEDGYLLSTLEAPNYCLCPQRLTHH